MKIYVDFTNGIAFYNDTIHMPGQIPAAAKEISEEVYREFLNNQGAKTINPETLQLEDKSVYTPTKEEQIATIRQETDTVISTPQLFLDKYTFALDDVDSLNSLSDLMEFKQETEKKILDKANIRHTFTLDKLNELVRTMGGIKDQLILDRDDKIEALSIGGESE